LAHERFDDFKDTLNRTLNKTVSQARLQVVLPARHARTAVITHVLQGRYREFSSIPLVNGHYLTALMEVRLTPQGVTTDKTAIAYRRSPELYGEDWIFRYEYERKQAAESDYAYPISHLHVNASPQYYAGKKPFPDLHLPTRRLSLEEIIRHLILEHDVPTLGSVEEALRFLDDQQADFERNRTDSGRPISPP